jgi:hypothetical protein
MPSSYFEITGLWQEGDRLKAKVNPAIVAKIASAAEQAGRGKTALMVFPAKPSANPKAPSHRLVLAIEEVYAPATTDKPTGVDDPRADPDW